MEDAPKQPSESAPIKAERCPERAVARRSFVKWTIGLLLTLMGAVFGWSFVSAIASRILSLAPLQYYKVNGFDAMPPGQPAKLTFSYVRLDAYVGQTVIEYVWAVKQSATEVVVFSPICTHLGCRYNWQAAAGVFVCPCHNSVFDQTGKVLSGPAPRPLDRLPWKIENGALYVEWEYFRAGVPAKIRT